MKPPKPPKLPKINGTNSADTIVGSSNPEEINGLAGDDIIFGYGDGSGVGGTPSGVDPDGGSSADADVLNGGDGHDTIHGGGGEDEIDGGKGDDNIYGGSGDDKIAGGAGFDTVYLNGTFDEYTFSFQKKKHIWTSAGPDGTDKIQSTEAIAFDDGFTLRLDGTNNTAYAVDSRGKGKRADYITTALGQVAQLTFAANKPSSAGKRCDKHRERLFAALSSASLPK